MIPLNKIKTVFFDYDGTLHDSIKIYAPAFRSAYDFLVNEGLAKEREWSDKEISYWLGFTPQNMWKSFMPYLQDELKEKCSSIISEEMKMSISEGRPVLYDGAIEVLEYLKNKGYRLIFISNCKIYYKEAHKKLFNLDKYFERLICSEEFSFIQKHEILRIIKDEYPKDMVIIGDRYQDIEAGKKNGIYTIGCSYGYTQDGELKEADLIIDNIMELKKCL
ncbi:Phosphoglycolate phosphatase [Caloramator mitchellensis]|uniref:Phosphoglycolate phosphatase n=1 Tax=Caloramator mitchellensis TaxID=908809 RepID=A0A0R3K5B7_CALMK|nr:HAD family hydrolase [Caloramator mitchellensis]KRQ87551.1 Phosphoglycolate phosphatase [Caloramator mitchellensis]